MHAPCFIPPSGLCVQHKVIVQSSTHLKPPVISHVEHPIRLLLMPMLPPMRPSLILVDLPILVLVFPGCLSNTVGVETNTNGHTILPIFQLNLVVQPVNLVPLIDIVRARRGNQILGWTHRQAIQSQQ